MIVGDSQAVQTRICEAGVVVVDAVGAGIVHASVDSVSLVTGSHMFCRQLHATQGIHMLWEEMRLM